MKALTFLVWKTHAAVTSLCLKEWDFSAVVNILLVIFPQGKKKALFPPPPETVGDRDVHKRIKKI